MPDPLSYSGKAYPAILVVPTPAQQIWWLNRSQMRHSPGHPPPEAQPLGSTLADWWHRLTTRLGAGATSPAIPQALWDATLARHQLGWTPQFPELDTLVAHAWGWEQKVAAGTP